MSIADGPLADILDAETLNVWTVLRNSVRTQGGIFDLASKAIEQLARERQHLLELTAELDEHPDDYNGPCWCATCRSYAVKDADAGSSLPMA